MQKEQWLECNMQRFCAKMIKQVLYTYIVVIIGNAKNYDYGQAAATEIGGATEL